MTMILIIIICLVETTATATTVMKWTDLDTMGRPFQPRRSSKMSNHQSSPWRRLGRAQGQEEHLTFKCEKYNWWMMWRVLLEFESHENSKMLKTIILVVNTIHTYLSDASFPWNLTLWAQNCQRSYIVNAMEF